MKKIFVSIAFVTIFLSAHAQTPEQAISNLHLLLQSAKVNFMDNLGQKLNEDASNGLVWYKTKYATLGASSRIIHQSVDNKNIYFIKYNTKNDDVYLKLMPTILAFIEEMHTMEESGNYVRRDYKDNQGMDVTEIKDKDGNHIINYFSNKESQNFYIFGMGNILK